MCHDKTYFAKLMNIDGTCAPIISGGIACSMIDSLQDIHDNASKMEYPYLMLLASKDIVVNNKEAIAWNKKTKTKDDKK